MDGRLKRYAACMWIYTKAVLCDGQETTQEYLRRRLLFIMESGNWVEEAVEDHEWVSDLTSASPCRKMKFWWL